MSEDRTKETNDAQSFEERVFARFDSADEPFDRVVDGMEIRITKLEARQFDTKPIWERALAEIAETNRKIELLQLAIEGLRKETSDNISGLRAEMKAEFENVRHEMKHALHGVGHKIEALNSNVLQVQADQRYVDSRLQELESQVESP